MSTSSSGVVERLLAERIGLDASSVGPSLLDRGVQARMSALGLRSRAVYEAMLTEADDEMQSLVEEIVVPESWFFRDDRPFEALDRFARAGWVVDPARPPLNAVSLPCAGGEEPYSIAMTLFEAGLTADRFRVDAVDVSAKSLSRAIAGVFGPNSFRGNGLRIRPKYFRQQSNAFAIVPAVRSAVHFRQGNLLDPTLFADRPPFDVVFCRNLLIYFNDESCVRAFTTLNRLLTDGGLLFLGHADRPDVADGSPFVPTGDKGCFSFRKGAASPKPVRTLRPSSSITLRAGGKLPQSGTVPGLPRPSPPAPLPKGEGRQIRLPLPLEEGWGKGRVQSGDVTESGYQKFQVRPSPSPSAPLPEGEGSQKAEASSATFPGKEEVKRQAEPSGLVLDQASALADRGRYDEATQFVEAAIRDGQGSAGAFFLLGMIRQAAGDRDRAEEHFLKAIYLDSQHDEALLALALLARRKGDMAAESVYRRRAERVLARKGSS